MVLTWANPCSPAESSARGRRGRLTGAGILRSTRSWTSALSVARAGSSSWLAKVALGRRPWWPRWPTPPPELGCRCWWSKLEGRPGVATAFGTDGPLDYTGSVLKAAGVESIDEDGADTTTAIPPGTVRARTITPRRRPARVPGRPRPSPGCPSACCPRGSSTWWPGPSPGSGTSWCWGRSSRSSASGGADLVLVDAPATGHTMTLPLVSGRTARRGPRGPDTAPGGRRGRTALRSVCGARSPW